MPGRYIRESKALFKVAGYGDAAGTLSVDTHDSAGVPPGHPATKHAQLHMTRLGLR